MPCADGNHGRSCQRTSPPHATVLELPGRAEGNWPLRYSPSTVAHNPATSPVHRLRLLLCWILCIHYARASGRTPSTLFGLRAHPLLPSLASTPRVPTLLRQHPPPGFLVRLFFRLGPSMPSPGLLPEYPGLGFVFLYSEGPHPWFLWSSSPSSEARINAPTVQETFHCVSSNYLQASLEGPPTARQRVE